MSVVAPYCGQTQQQTIQVPRPITYQSYQYSPEEGCWVMPPYGQLYNFNSQADAQSQAWVPPGVRQLDIFLAQQTWPL